MWRETNRGFIAGRRGYEPFMHRVGAGHLPRLGEIWLSRPPYLLIARVIEVDRRSNPGVVSYELHDEEGFLLEQVNRASLDDGWWHAFQPLTRRFG